MSLDVGLVLFEQINTDSQDVFRCTVGCSVLVMYEPIC